jgi:pimeloyl-ACP methyl ester carboxylesterase
VNVDIASYAWLAIELAKRNNVVILFSWIAEDFPGSVSLTPGMDLNFIKPDTYGTGPSANALPAILDEVQRLNQSGLLAGSLDLNRIFLGGHSAGGTMALLNANRQWFPQVQGAFTYGAHSGASTMLGFPPAIVLPLHDCPTLIMGGTRDGVIESSSHRYALDGNVTPTLLLERTFREGANKDSALVIFEGTNHFLATHPHDDTTGRGFLEQASAGSEADANARQLLIELVDSFIQNKKLDEFASDPLIAKFEMK